jgi:hypothetical protein
VTQINFLRSQADIEFSVLRFFSWRAGFLADRPWKAIRARIDIFNESMMIDLRMRPYLRQRACDGGANLAEWPTLLTRRQTGKLQLPLLPPSLSEKAQGSDGASFQPRRLWAGWKDAFSEGQAPLPLKEDRARG